MGLIIDLNTIAPKCFGLNDVVDKQISITIRRKSVIQKIQIVVVLNPNPVTVVDGCSLVV